MNGTRKTGMNVTRWFLGGLLVCLLMAGSSLRAAAADEATTDTAKVGATGAEEAAWSAITALNERSTPPELKPGEQPTQDQIKEYMAQESARLDKLMDALVLYRANYPEGKHAADSLTMMGKAIDQAMQASRGKSAKARELTEKLLAEKDLPEAIGQGLYMAKMIGMVLGTEAGAEKVMDTEGPKLAVKIQALVKEYEQRYPDSTGLADLQFMTAQIFEYLGDNASAKAAYQAIVDSKAEIEPGLKQQAEQAVKRYDVVGNPLDIKFTALDGREVDLAAMKGKVVLVDFWATWCGPCMAELPEVLKVYKDYHDKGFEIVGISFDQDKDALEKTLKEKGMTWPQYYDGKGWENAIGQKYGIAAIPAMWLVGKDGNVQDINARQDLGGKVARLLGVEPVAEATPEAAPEKAADAAPGADAAK